MSVIRNSEKCKNPKRIMRTFCSLTQSLADVAMEVCRKVIIYESWDVYAWTRNDQTEFQSKSEISFHKMSNEELIKHAAAGGRLKNQAELFFRNRGIDNIYGFFIGDELVHSSWVYTIEECKKDPAMALELNKDEVEIKHCLTPEQFRGRGLYVYAIRCLSDMMFRQGFVQVFMTVDLDNEPSKRGIEKAGLKHIGQMKRVGIMIGGRRFTRVFKTEKC